MVGLLVLAHDRCCEAALAARLADLLEAGTLPELEPLEVLRPRGSPDDYNDLIDHPAGLATPRAGAA